MFCPKGRLHAGRKSFFTKSTNSSMSTNLNPVKRSSLSNSISSCCLFYSFSPEVGENAEGLGGEGGDTDGSMFTFSISAALCD